MAVLPLATVREERVGETAFYTSLDLNEETCSALLKNFSGLTNVVPVVALGQFGQSKRDLLDRLAGKPLFKSAQIECDVSCCVSPMQVEDSHLLLLMMKGFEWEMSDRAKKVLHILLSTVAISLVCVENSAFLPTARSVRRVLERINSPMACSKCFFVLRNLDTLKGKTKTDFEALQCSECFEAVEQQELSVHRLKLTDRTKWRIQDFFTTLRNLAHIFEFCPTHASFDDADLEYLREERRLVLSQRSAKLLTIESGEVSLNRTALDALGGIEKPTCVLMIVGEPGLGKSTLLNELLKSLLRLNAAPQVFAVSNTTTHTTRESEIVPATLHLTKDLQVLLVDLEGVGGLETADLRLRETQRLFVSALIAFASVPCIIVRNDVNSLKFLEERIQEIAAHKAEFSYAVRKINLLFHDRDPSASSNHYFVQEVEKMKAQYGLTETEIEILNKPSFASSSTIVKDEFTKKLLEASHFPKTNTRGEVLGLGDILRNLEEILDSRRQLSELFLSPEESLLVEDIKSEASLLISKWRDGLHMNDISKSICEAFQRQVEDFISAVESRGKMRVGMRRKLSMEIWTLVETQQTELRSVEVLAKQLALVPDLSETCLQMEAYCRGSKLLALLDRVKFHYPVLAGKITAAVSSYQQQSWLCRVLRYSAVGASGLAASLLLLTLLRMRRQVLESAQFFRHNIKQHIFASSLGLLSGSVVSSSAQLSSAMPKSIAALPAVRCDQRRSRLVSIASGVLCGLTVALAVAKKAVTVTEVCLGVSAAAAFVFALSSRTPKNPHTIFVQKPLLQQFQQLGTKAAVTLVLGVDNPAQSNFVGELVRWCYPYSLLGTFKLMERVEVLPVAYVQGNVLSRGLVISISLPLSTPLDSKPFEQKLSNALLPLASQTVIFNSNKLLQSLPLESATTCCTFMGEETQEMKERIEELQLKGVEVHRDTKASEILSAHLSTTDTRQLFHVLSRIVQHILDN